MTAQPITQEPPHTPWTPDPMRQRLANYTIEDVLNLPDDAPRVELLDGVPIVVPSPTPNHQNIGNLLWMWFRNNAPKRYRTATAVGVAVSTKETYEPDVVLFAATADMALHYVNAEDTEIAVEVVSPGTRKRDRFIKPAGYAAAGIQHYWRVEQDPVHVYAYTLNINGHYDLVSDSAELLVLSEPFDIKLPISEITP